ncbi:hypothetical protein VL15_37855 [Burkholderia cepacia]|uniref:Fimbrial-type adhesion domain-containing protein n=1 Tax=Burkholderia cepacia TaxID=292 RepID=A0A0J5W4T2_BURCE|nr:hypothetical protein VL15_37855 [Burkholderia cepacia]
MLVSWLGTWTNEAQASSSTVNVYGDITASACNVVKSDQSKRVTLGSIPSKQFAGVGSTGLLVPFTLSLENCMASASGVSVTFNGSADLTNSNLLAVNTGGGAASGIGIELLDDTRTQIPINSASKVYSFTGDAGRVHLKFFARYMATQPTVTSGDANASMTFTLSYQ